MKTKINSLTIINLQGSHCYSVGGTYNGLVLDYIEDMSIYYPESVSVIYKGFTETDGLVFEVINAPIDVEYAPDNEGEAP